MALRCLALAPTVVGAIVVQPALAAALDLVAARPGARAVSGGRIVSVSVARIDAGVVVCVRIESAACGGGSPRRTRPDSVVASLPKGIRRNKRDAESGDRSEGNDSAH